MTADELVDVLEEHKNLRYIAIKTTKGDILYVIDTVFDYHDGNLVIFKVVEEKRERLFIVNTVRLFLSYFKQCELMFEYNDAISKIGDFSIENDTIILEEIRS